MSLGCTLDDQLQQWHGAIQGLLKGVRTLVLNEVIRVLTIREAQKAGLEAGV